MSDWEVAIARVGSFDCYSLDRRSTAAEAADMAECKHTVLDGPEDVH